MHQTYGTLPSLVLTFTMWSNDPLKTYLQSGTQVSIPQLQGEYNAELLYTEGFFKYVCVLEHRFINNQNILLVSSGKSNSGCAHDASTQDQTRSRNKVYQ